MNMHMVETSDRDSIRPVSILAWQDRPMGEGYYFVWIHHVNTESAGVVYINENNEFRDHMYWDSEGFWQPYTEYCSPLKVSWMGPLLLPSKPGE